MSCRAYIQVYTHTMSVLRISSFLLMTVAMDMAMAKPVPVAKNDDPYIRYNPSLWNVPSPTMTPSAIPNHPWIADSYIENGLTIYSIEPTSLYVKNSVMAVMNIVFILFAFAVICYGDN